MRLASLGPRQNSIQSMLGSSKLILLAQYWKIELWAKNQITEHISECSTVCSRDLDINQNK